MTEKDGESRDRMHDILADAALGLKNVNFCGDMYGEHGSTKCAVCREMVQGHKDALIEWLERYDNLDESVREVNRNDEKEG